MKKGITCNNCLTVNPFFRLNCINCGSYIRERIVNIDLGKTLLSIIDSPVKTFQNIIFAEHKNYIFLISFFASIKLYINSVFLILFLEGEKNFIEGLILKFAAGFAGLIIFLYLFSFLSQLSLNIFKVETTVKDNFSLHSYTLVPFSLTLFFLFVIEFTVFGRYLFSVNPSPFVLNSVPAYIFLILELLTLFWVLFLSITSYYAVCRSKMFSLILGSLFFIVLNLFFYILQKFYLILF